MSISAAIQGEYLGKLYRLGEIDTGTLSQGLNRAWARLRNREDPYAKIGEAKDRTQQGQSTFAWSLQDVNFARYGTKAPVPADFLTQAESRIRDLWALLDAFRL